MFVEIPKARARALAKLTAMWAIILIVAAPCFTGGLKVGNSAKPMRVLFVGNSLTYANDLPAIVESLAEASGERRPDYKVVAFPNFSLEDHWNQGEARRALARGVWDVVVLQQGPSASAEGRENLLEYTRRFAREIHNAGARPALYMVWPFASRAGDFDRVSESYALAAREADGMLLPVGEAWRNAFGMDSSLPLYSSDGLHPTQAGSYLAALVIYGQLYRAPTLGLPSKLKLPNGTKIEIPAEQARLLQKAAAEANTKFSRP